MIFGCRWSVQSYHSYFELQRTMSKPASNQRWWSWQRRLSLLESLSLESFAVQFADVWISLASGLPALPSPRATIACDKAATSCAGQCSGNGICESEATALLHFELPDITRPAACATWSLGDPQLIHSWSTVDSLEVQYVHQLLCLLGLANADAMKASMERPWDHLRFSVFKLDPLFVSVSSFFSLHLEYWACTVAILILCITVSVIWRDTYCMEIHDMGEPNLQADLWSRRPEHDGRIRDMPYIYI
jgi:hypothetical protein